MLINALIEEPDAGKAYYVTHGAIKLLVPSIQYYCHSFVFEITNDAFDFGIVKRVRGIKGNKFVRKLRTDGSQVGVIPLKECLCVFTASSPPLSRKVFHVITMV